MILPEFILEDYELIDSDPGWLFDPREILSVPRRPSGT
jgi:hypothetical protein